LDLRIENIQLKRDYLAGLKRRDRSWPRKHPLSFAEMDRAIEIAGAPLFLNLPEEAVIRCGLGQRLDFIHRGGRAEADKTSPAVAKTRRMGRVSQC